VKITISNIRIIDIDTASVHGPRTLKIQTQKVSIETPCRMITSTESRFKKDLALSPLDERSEIKAPLFELVKTPRLRTILDLRRVNGILNKQRKSINNSLRGFEESITFLNLRFRKGKEPPIQDVESLIHLQCTTKLDLVSIPDLSKLSEKREFETYITHHRRDVESICNKEAVPIVDMNSSENVFKMKIETIIENGFNMIVLRCRSFSDYYANYRFIKDTKEEEKVWFHMVDTFRTNPSPTATLNYTNLPQVFGIDTVSPLTPYGGGETQTPAPENTKRFDRLSFDNLPLKTQKEKYDDLLRCNCPICQERTVSDYIDDYRSCRNPKEKNPIYKWSRLHEIFATNSEFEMGRNFIRSQEFDSYLRSKVSAQNFLSSLASRTS
jgi:hypothetical protein